MDRAKTDPARSCDVGSVSYTPMDRSRTDPTRPCDVGSVSHRPMDRAKTGPTRGAAGQALGPLQEPPPPGRTGPGSRGRIPTAIHKQADNWHSLSPSQFAWEQEALDYVRRHLGASVPGAWSNFEFLSQHGAIYEVDLMVLTRDRLYLVEIKSWSGLLKGDSATWFLQDGLRQKVLDNPLFLLNTKAKVLRGLLGAQQAFKAVRAEVPYIQPLVFLSSRTLECELEEYALQNITFRDELARPPRRGLLATLAGDATRQARLDRGAVKRLQEAFEQAGIRAPQRSRMVGDYRLQEILQEGPGYQDRLGEHQSLEGVTRRIRHFLITRAASQEERDMVRRAAEREFRLVESFRHPGILRPQDFKVHEYGPALLYEHDPEALRLDLYLEAHLDRLGLEERLDLWRQVVDALRYAHGRKVLHRALSPRSILVADPATAHPRVLVTDWRTGSHLGDTTGGTMGTIHVQDLVESAATAYVAPEALTAPERAGEYSDLFSLGALGYLILSGCPPARDHLGLHQLLQRYKGLRLSSVQDGVPQKLDELIFRCTHVEVGERPPSTEHLFQALDEILQDLRHPQDAEETTPANPLDAQPGERLGDYAVRSVLGQGSVSKAWLVERDDELLVLKLARDPADNARLQEEGEVLAKLDHRHIARLVEPLHLGERAGLVLEVAGRETLAARLLDSGPLHLDLLQRFGDDLLSAVEHLEKEGIPHRDVKPGNLGVAPMGSNQELHLVLFDFSLSRVPADNVRAGTPQYLDPFLPRRRPPRWDLQAERYSVAVTLYEMATGVLPRWGDGLSDPSLSEQDLVLEADRFEPSLRDTLTRFFRQALDRDWTRRFDHAQAMRQAWNEAFAPAGQAEASPAPPAADLSPESPVASLGLSAGALQALDRLGVVTVADLLRRPAREIGWLRGVGNQTRREVLDTLERLLERFPSSEPARPEAPAPSEEGATFSLDRLVRELLEARGVRRELRPVAEAWLGLDRAPEEGLAWATPSQVALRAKRGLQEVARALPDLRATWATLASLAGLRDDLRGILGANGGALALDEMAQALLAARGSASNLPHRRNLLALAVTRAALEAEATEDAARFMLHRLHGRPFVVLDPEAGRYAEALGEVADGLVGEDPLPPPYRVLQSLREVPAPPGLELADPRLLRLAAGASASAAVSAREELYPRSMPARRALLLAHGALLGESRLAADEVRRRVAGRYPEAEPLPDRPELDALLKDAGWDFAWAEAEQAYLRVGAPGGTATSSSYTRFRSTEAGRRALTGEEAESARLDEALLRSRDEGSFLALSVRPRWYREARQELEGRFGVEVRSLDRLLVEALRETAAEKRVDWNLVLAADGAPGTRDWTNLMRLVRAARPRVESRLRSADRPVLLVEAGLLARYDLLDLLEDLRDRAGSRDGTPAVWLLLPSDEQNDLPLLDGHPVPLLTPGQRARIPRAWLRAARGEAPA